MSANLDRHFRRFRDQGDVSALAEVFDEVAPEMLRVARHLAYPSLDPHDLIQSTFLVAIERASAYDPARPVKQWLLGILAKEAAYQRRRGARVVEPDRLDAHPEPDPLDAAAGTEFSRALEEALELLPEKYREVVRPILLEGKNPKQVAREVGQRPGTVRVQLHRGLRLLRESLPAGYALGALVALRPTGAAASAAAGAGASAGLGAVRTRVLLEGAGREGLATVGGPLAGGAVRVALWGAVLAGAGAVLFQLRGGEERGLEAASRTATLTRSDAVDDASGLASGGRVSVPVAAAPIGDSAGEPAGLATVAVLGRVLGLDCQPAVGASVTLDIAGAGTFEGTADLAGDFRIPVVLGAVGTWSGAVRVRDANGHAHARSMGLRADGREVYLGSMMLGAAGPISVRAEAVDGRALAGAEVEVHSSVDRLVLARGVTGPDGSVEFGAVPRGGVSVRARAGDRFGAVEQRGGKGRRQIVVRLDQVGALARGLPSAGSGSTGSGSAGSGGEPTGSGTGEAREPSHAILRLVSPAGPIWSPDWGFLSAGASLEYRTNTDGETEVRVAGAEPGDSVLFTVEVDGFRPVTQRVELRQRGLPNPVDVALDPITWLSVDVRRDPALDLELELQRFDPGVGDYGPSRLDFGGLAVPNTPEGLFRFDGLTPGVYRLRERRSDLVSEPIEVVGGEGRLQAALDLSVLRMVTGRVELPDPALTREVSLVMEAEGVDSSPNRWTPLQNFQMTTHPRADGRFRMLVPGDREVRLRAYHPLLVARDPDGANGWVDPLAAEGELVLGLTWGQELSLPLHGLAGRRPLDRVRVLRYADEPEGAPLDCLYPRIEGGVARFAGVPPGVWTLFVDLGAGTGVQPLVLRNVVVTAGRTLTLPEPDLDPGGTIAVNLTDLRSVDGATEEDRITLFARSHGQPEYVRIVTGVSTERLELTGLGPGEFTLRVQTPRSPRPLLEQVLSVGPGQTRELSLGL